MGSTVLVLSLSTAAALISTIMFKVLHGVG